MKAAAQSIKEINASALATKADVSAKPPNPSSAASSPMIKNAPIQLVINHLSRNRRVGLDHESHLNCDCKRRVHKPGNRFQPLPANWFVVQHYRIHGLPMFLADRV